MDLPVTFKESGMLSFRVTPKPDRIDIFVTKSDLDQSLDFDDLADMANLDEISQMTPDEFLKTLEKTVRDKSMGAGDGGAVRHLEEVEHQEEATGDDHPYVYYILHFSDLGQAVRFAHTIDFEVDTSELYRMDDTYYMTVLIHVANRSQDYPTHLLARMLEHVDDTPLSRPVLQEHGTLLLASGALEELRKVQLS